MSTLSGGPNIVVDGLVLYLDAGNTKSYISGSTTWNDISRVGNNSTLINGPTFDTGSGGGIVFDGSNDRGQISNFNYGRSACSIEAWFKFNSFSPSGFKVSIISKWQTGAGNNNEFILVSEGSVGESPYWPIFTVQISDNTKYSAIDNTLIQQVGVWYHQVGVFDGSNVQVFVNGTLRKTTAIPNPPQVLKTIDAQPIGIGAFGSTFQYLSNLTVASSRIYNRALSAQEILQNFNATKGRFQL